MSAYTTGTITLTNGSAAITGTDTGWATAIIAGGVIYPDAAGNALPIAAVVDDTHITAAVPWRGTSGTYAYALMRDTSDGQQAVANAQALATYIARLDNKALAAIASLTPAADRIAYMTSGTTAALTPFSDLARQLLDDTTQAAMRATIGAFAASGGTVTGNIRIDVAGQPLLELNGGATSYQYVSFSKAGMWRANVGIENNADAAFFVDMNKADGTWLGRPIKVAAEALRVEMPFGIDLESTANTTKARIIGYGNGTGYGIGMRAGMTGAAEALRFFTPGLGYVGGIVHNDTSTIYLTTSDYRLKTDVEPLVTFGLTADQFDVLDDVLLRVMAMRPVSYTWTAHPEAGLQTGFIAHEMQIVAPHAVSGSKDAVEDIGTATIAGYTIPAHTVPGEAVTVIDPATGELIEMMTPATDVPAEVVADQVHHDVLDGEIPGATWVQTGTRPVYQGVDHGRLTPDLVAAVQSLTLMVLDLQAQIAAAPPSSEA